MEMYASARISLLASPLAGRVAGYLCPLRREVKKKDY